MMGFVNRLCVVLVVLTWVNGCVYAEVVQFKKENFTEEANLRSSIISDTCEGSSICIDSFKKGEFGTNEIGIIKYDLNDDGKKDDALICFQSSYFCGARGICSSVMTKKNNSDTFHGHCMIQVLDAKHVGHRDIKFPCDLESNPTTEFAIMSFDGNRYKFVQFCKKTSLSN
jgi:hypothetical protein